MEATTPMAMSCRPLPPGQPNAPPARLPPFWEGGPPVVESEAVRPTVEEVAILERTRTVDSSGTEWSTFTPDTRPTADEVELLIDHALDEILGQLPPHMDPCWYPAISRVIALRTAATIEVSFFREQASATVSAWTARFANDLDALRSLIPSATYIA